MSKRSNLIAAMVHERDMEPDRPVGGFWRMEDPVVTTTPSGQPTLVRGGMFAPQREWWELRNFIKVFVGGYGAGKTMIFCKRMIALALENAPVPGAMVSPTYPMMRQSLIPTMTELLDGKRAVTEGKLEWNYNKSTHEFDIAYRGRQAKLIGYSGEDPAALKGSNLGFAGIDEPFIQDREVFLQMVARIRHPQAKRMELDLTGTPEQLNWGYDLCEGKDEAYKDVGVVNAPTSTNKALSPDYEQRLRSMYSEKAVEAYVLGKFVNLTEGLVYYAFSEANIQDIPMPTDGLELGAGMDFNVNPMTAAVFWKAGERMHFIEDIELPNADTQYMCAMLKERYGDKLRTIYPDATGAARHTSSPGGKSDFHYIREAGFDIYAPGQSPKVRDRHNAVNGKFKPSTGKPTTLTISPNCRRLIKYLRTYAHETANKQQELSHLLDAFSYPVVYLFPAHSNTIKVMRLGGL